MQNKFYIVRRPETRLGIESFREEPLPILWDFDGSFCIIPVAILQNAIRNQEMYDKSSDKTIKPGVFIHWDQGIYIDNEIGRALLGE